MTINFWYPVLLFLASLIISCNNVDKKQSNGSDSNISPFEEINTQIAKNSSDPQLYYKRARLFYENESPDPALSDLEKAMMLDSTKPEYYHLLADVYLDYFKSYDAVNVMKSAADRFPNEIPTLLKLTEFHHILKQYDKSFETIDRVLKQDPQNAEAYFMLGMSLREIGKDTMAINSFQSAVENDPNLIDAWIILGQMYAQLGDPLAKRYFDNALLIDSTNLDVLHAKAFYLNEVSDLDGALATYRKIVSFSPNYEDAYFNSGLIYIEMDSMDRAIEQFDLLLEISPIYVKGFYYRGLTKEMTGDFQAAADDFKNALKFAPGYTSAKEALERVEREL